MLYADANVIIRLIEGDAAARAAIEARLSPFRGTARFLATSRLNRLECRVKPLRNGDLPLLASYDAFLSSPEVELLASASAFLTADRSLARCTEISVEIV